MIPEHVAASLFHVTSSCVDVLGIVLRYAHGLAEASEEHAMWPSRTPQAGQFAQKITEGIDLF